jgi:hypothetical protein
MSKTPQFCSRCNQLKVQGRDLVGMGWIVCECDKPKQPKKEMTKAEKTKQPFVFIE